MANFDFMKQNPRGGSCPETQPLTRIEPGVFEGFYQQGHTVGFSYYSGRQRVCTVAGKKLPFSWITIQGFGYSWYSMFDPEDAYQMSHSKNARWVLDSATRKPVFQIKHRRGGRFEVLIENMQAEAIVSSSRIEFFVAKEALATIFALDNSPDHADVYYSIKPIHLVRLFQPVSPSCLLAILSFPCLFFGFRDFDNIWDLWSAANRRYSNACDYSLSSAEFSVSKMTEADREAFASLMQNMHWERDEDLFFLAMLEPPHYYFSSYEYQSSPSVHSSHLKSKLTAFLQVLAHLFRDLEATFCLRYGGSDLSWAAGLIDNGASIVITLENGKVTHDETVYS